MGSMDTKFHWLYNLARHTYSPWYVKTHHVSLVNKNNYDISEGPFLILSNHVGTHDPIEIGSVLLHRHIHWVAGAYMFKMPFVGWIMGKVCELIPKQQGRGDFETIRLIKKHFKEGKIVGLFPEGTRTWDGNMMPINYQAIAKMIHSFKVPVVFISIEGGYASEPRWALKRRKGPVSINMRYLMSEEEAMSLSVEDLAVKIKENLDFSNETWKKTVDYHYESKNRAEGLQRTLYMCPKCHKIGTLETKGDKIFCSDCGFEATLTKKDDLLSKDTKLKTVVEWHNWEMEALKECKGFSAERGRLFQVGDSNDKGTLTDLSKDITISLENDEIIVKCNDGITKVFHLPLSKITSFILNAKQTMELFCDERLYRIRLSSDSSSLKYNEYYLAYLARSKKEEQ